MIIKFTYFFDNIISWNFIWISPFMMAWRKMFWNNSIIVPPFLWGDYIPLIMGIINPIITNVKNGGAKMIKFDKLWKTMEEKSVSTYWLREKCGIDRKTIRRLHGNENIETKTLNKLCCDVFRIITTQRLFIKHLLWAWHCCSS